MHIHIISNSLRMNSGFSNVAKNLLMGLRKLGHDVSFTGMQTPYLSEWMNGIEILPITTFHVDELTQYTLNLKKNNPNAVIAIFQSDTGDLIHFPLAFKNTFWYTVVEGDILSFNSTDGYRRVIANGGKIVLPSKHGQIQAQKSGIKTYNISYGFDNKIFKPLNLKDGKIREDDIKYCFYHTELGKVISDPIKLCKQGCYSCILEGKYQTKCQYFQEELITILSYDKEEKRWSEKRIRISQLPNEYRDKFILGHVKQNIGVRHRMERLLKAYSIFINQSRQLKDRTILHLHTMPIANNGINLIYIIESLGIENNIIFSYGDYIASSWSDNAMNILYNTFDCNVSASSGEGYGIPTLESMACGIPQIGPESSAFIELIDDKKTKIDNKEINKEIIGPRGLLTKIATWQLIQDGSYRSLVDEEDLAKCMRLLYNCEYTKIYSKNGIKFANQFTWENVTQKWDELLKSM